MKKQIFFIGAFLISLALLLLPEMNASGAENISIFENISEGEFIKAVFAASQLTAMPLYFARESGQPVYAPGSDAAPSLAPGVCVCDHGGAWRVPEWITLNATSTGVGSIAKITPFDNAAEGVQGAMGTIFFGITEIPFGAGTIAKEDGTFIFAGDIIRAITTNRMLVIDYMTMDGTDVAATSSKDLNWIRGFISGNDNKLLKFMLDPNNQTAVTVLKYDALQSLGSPIMWKSNEGWQYTFNLAAGVVNIHMHIAGFQYYGV